MINHRHADKFCLAAMAAAVLLTVVLLFGDFFGITRASASPEYAGRLFDAERVHTIDILLDGWDAFLETAAEEEYTPCSVVIDGEEFPRVGLRAKGNNSRRLTAEYGLDRYSLKIEFDHYQPGNYYYGLDKLSWMPPSRTTVI